MSTDCVAWADSDDGSHCPVASPRIVSCPFNRHCGIGGACASAPRLPRQRIGGPRPVSLRGSGGFHLCCGASGPERASTRALATHTWVRRDTPPGASSPRVPTGGRLPRETEIGGTCRVVPARGFGGVGPVALSPRTSPTLDLFWPLAGHLGWSPGRRPPTLARIENMRWCAVGWSTTALFSSSWTDTGAGGQPTVSHCRRHAVWGPCGVSRARLLRVPLCARSPPAAPRRPPPHPTRTACLARAHRLPWFSRRLHSRA